MSASLLLPRAGMTLLPPWPMFVLFAGKRIENRSRGVGMRVGKWRGLIAFGMSRTFDEWETRAAIESVTSEPWYRCRVPEPFRWSDLTAWAGHLVGVAELIDVRPNGPNPSDPWAVPGEWGLHLGRVWQIEQIPVSGGRGVHALGGCGGCGHVGAIDERGAPLVCRRCRVTTPRAHLLRPELKVLRAFGADGEAVSA